MEDRSRKPGEGPEKPPGTAVPIRRQEVHQGRAGEGPVGCSDPSNGYSVPAIGSALSCVLGLAGRDDTTPSCGVHTVCRGRRPTADHGPLQSPYSADRRPSARQRSVRRRLEQQQIGRNLSCQCLHNWMDGDRRLRNGGAPWFSVDKYRSVQTYPKTFPRERRTVHDPGRIDLHGRLHGAVGLFPCSPRRSDTDP